MDSLVKAVPGYSTYSTYSNVFTQLGDGKFDLGDLTAPAAAAIDVMGWVCDPAGAFAGAALGPLLDFLANNFPPLKWPLDRLAGEQAAIQQQAQSWMEVAQAVADAGNAHAAAAGDLPNWVQQGSAEYHQIQKDINLAFAGAAKQCSSVANSIEVAGMVCAGVRQFIWDWVKSFVTSAVGNAVAAVAISWCTGGGSLAAFVAWFQGKMAWVMGKITGKLSELCSWLAQATSKWSSLSSKFDDAAAALKTMSKRKFSQSGGFSSSASKKTGGRVKVKEVDKPSVVGDDTKKTLDGIRKPAKKVVSPANAADKADDKYDKSVPQGTPTVNSIP